MGSLVGRGMFWELHRDSGSGAGNEVRGGSRRRGWVVRGWKGNCAVVNCGWAVGEGDAGRSAHSGVAVLKDCGRE